MSRLRLILASAKPKTLLPLADLLMINAAVLAGLWLWTVRDNWRIFNAQFVLSRAHWFLTISAAWLLLAVTQDFYRRRTTRQLLSSLITLFSTIGILVVLYFAVYFFAPRNNTLPRGVILSIAAISFLFVGIWRLAYFAMMIRRRSREALLTALDTEWQSVTTGSDGSSTAVPEEPDPLDNEILTVQDVADHLKVSQATIWRWCKSGKLPAFRVGQQWRIRAVDLNTVVNANNEEDTAS